MTSKSLAIAGIFAASLVSADVSISVQYDATYSLPKSHGLSCSGNGAKPAGTKCPKAGDVAIADCKPYLLSYSEAGCVAPVDAECVLVINDTWGCAFPQIADTETSKAYTGEGANYDKTLDALLNVNCDVASDEIDPNNYGLMDIGTSEGNSHGQMISEGGNDHMTTDTADNGSKTHTTENGITPGHDEPGFTEHDSIRRYEPGLTSDGMKGHHEGNGHDENTEAVTENPSSFPSKDVTGNHHTKEPENVYPTAEKSGAYPTDFAYPTEGATYANPTEAAHPTEELSDTEHGIAEVPTIATELGGATGPGNTTAAPGGMIGTPVSLPADATETLTSLTASATELPLGSSAYTPETPVPPPAYTTLTLASQ